MNEMTTPLSVFAAILLFRYSVVVITVVVVGTGIGVGVGVGAAVVGRIVVSFCSSSLSLLSLPSIGYPCISYTMGTFLFVLSFVRSIVLLFDEEEEEEDVRSMVLFVDVFVGGLIGTISCGISCGTSCDISSVVTVG